MKRDFEMRFGSGLHVLAICLLLLFALISAGCRSVKETVKSSIEVIKATNVQSSNVVDTSRVDSTATHVTQSIATSDSSYSTVIDIWLSKPDSLGNQYVQRITKTESGRLQQTRSEKDLTKGQTIKAAGKQVQSTSIQSETTEKSKVATKTKEDPITKWPLIILACGVLVLAYFVLKRFFCRLLSCN